MCSLLQDVQTQMAHNPRLRLFDDVDKNIWEFYENVMVTLNSYGRFPYGNLNHTFSRWNLFK